MEGVCVGAVFGLYCDWKLLALSDGGPIERANDFDDFNDLRDCVCSDTFEAHSKIILLAYEDHSEYYALPTVVLSRKSVMDRLQLWYDMNDSQARA